MRKLFLRYRFQALNALVLFLAMSSWALADDRFAVAVGPHSTLVIFGPKGERVAELTIPSISQPVTVGSTSFQVSYGRDANDLVTAIFAPSPSDPQGLHFNVLNKSVDTDKQAVITLTFTSGFSSVMVDPGYIGMVQVNSRNVRHHSLADDTYIPRPVTPTRAPTPQGIEPVPPQRTSESAPAPHPSADMTPRDIPAPVFHPSPAPATIESSPHVSSAPPPAAPAPVGAAPVNPLAGTLIRGIPGPPVAFWSEPVTPPNGPPPPIRPNEMKLVEVHGPVTVKTPDGNIVPGTNGMILPSGSTVQTASHASAAVFMGGVNSARLLPETEIAVQQNVNGSVRKTSIDLRQGTVFSRIGRRVGEKQDYQVRTPQGVAAARGTEMVDYLSPSGHHFIYVAKGTVDVYVDGVLTKVLTGHPGDPPTLDATVLPPSDDDLDLVLEDILNDLAPYNEKLLGVIDRRHDGTATQADNDFYESIKNTFAEGPDDLLQDAYWDFYPNPGGVIPLARRASDQVLVPFGTVELTPF
jgi:hypothetical protein